MSQQFTDKFFPKDFDEFIGNVELVDSTIKWAQDWEEGRKQKPLLFFGSPGVGKTTIAQLIARKMGWQLFEMNSSDLRNKDTIEKIAGAATNNSTLFGSKRLILIDEVDTLHRVDRGGAGAISLLLKDANNPIILTANNIYSDKRLLPLRSLATLKEFRKINYLSIAKRLREICEKENIVFDPEAIKELAKNSGGDFRSALLDTQSLAPEIKMEEVKKLYPRRREEKIFPVMTKIFKGKTIAEIQQIVENSEVSSDLLFRWVEENIPRQYDSKDTARAFEILSRGDIFYGRIFRRQNYSFLKYVYFLSTVGVGLSKEKEYHGWQPFQFPVLLTSLSASTSKRAMRKKIASKIGEKTHCSIRQGMKDISFVQVLLEKKELAHKVILFFGFDEKEVAFLLVTKPTTKKIQNLMEQADLLEKEIIATKGRPKQTSLFV